MKKALLFLAGCLMVLTIQAQAKHLNFMGIPLNGTITQFQGKLTAKGLTPYTKLNQVLPVGTRAFEGTFAGEEAVIHTYYNTKTKIVYRAKAVIDALDKNDVEDKLKKYKNQLTEKYSLCEWEDREYEGRPAYVLSVYDDEKDYLGAICLYTSYHIEYCLHVDYLDCANSEANENKNMDDL